MRTPNHSGWDEWTEIKPSAQHIAEATMEVEVVLNWGEHKDATFDDVSAIFDKIFFEDNYKSYPDDFYWEMESAQHDRGSRAIWMLQVKPEVAQIIKDHCESYIDQRAIELAMNEE